MQKRLLNPVILGLLFALAIPAWAAQPSQTDAADETLFTGGKIIDGSGRAPIPQGSLLIRGSKIEKVFTSTPAKVPHGVRVVDLHGKVIMPTLISAHSHLGLTKGASTSSANFTADNVQRQLRTFAKYGVGTVMSLGTDHDSIYEIRDLRNQGSLDGAHVLTAGRGFGVDNCLPPVAMGIDQVYRPATVDEARKDCAELFAHHPNIAKIWVDDNFGKCAKMTPKIYHAIIQEAHRHGLKVAAHIWYLQDAKDLVDQGIDVLAHSIRDTQVDEALISAMRKKGVYLIPTLDLDEAAFAFADQPAYMHSEFFLNAVEPDALPTLQAPNYTAKAFEKTALETAKHNLKTMFDAGIKIGFGTDSGAKLERIEGFAEHRELQLMVEAGLTPLQAIKCATKNNAELLGISKSTGTLEAGKQANLMILDADPSVDIANTQKISKIYIDGRAVKRD